MKILFSPSEGKTKLYDCDAFGRDSFLFPELYEKRVYAVKVYNDYIVNNRAEDIQDIFGIKDIDEIKQYQNNIFEEKTSHNTCVIGKSYLSLHPQKGVSSAIRTRK